MMRAGMCVWIVLASFGCTVDAPELSQDQVFFCTVDSDCIEGFYCYQDVQRCVADGFIIPDVVTSDTCSDKDGDGFAFEPGCGVTDCDDDNDKVFPGAPELCDGIDNDCDKFEDQVDGFPNLGIDCFVGSGDCLSKGSFVCKADGSATECNAVPVTPVAEICEDNIDNDCDGKVDIKDEDCISCTSGEACSFGDCAGTVSPELCPCNGFKDCTEGGNAGICKNEDGQPVTAPFSTDDNDMNGIDDDCDGNIDQ